MSGQLKVMLLDHSDASPAANPIHLRPLASMCKECRVSGLCLPTGLPLHDNSCLSA